MNRRAQAGLTLIEVLIAVSLLSLLSLGMLFALRIGLNSMIKANAKLMDNRRVAGTQRVLQQQLAGFMPMMAMCGVIPGGGKPGFRAPFFQGEIESMRMISSYSLESAARGIPHILEFHVIPGEQDKGVRLVVNEIPFTGPFSAGALCLGLRPEPPGQQTLRFQPIEAGATSFVLADKLAYCRFSYLIAVPPPLLQVWRPTWVLPHWPLGIRIDMASLDPDPSRLHPVTVTVPIHVDRDPLINYGDNGDTP
jgi:prepilin-type N-terminal cleavage/methylation domain-containing protein